MFLGRSPLARALGASKMEQVHRFGRRFQAPQRHSAHGGRIALRGVLELGLGPDPPWRDASGRATSKMLIAPVAKLRPQRGPGPKKSKMVVCVESFTKSCAFSSPKPFVLLCGITFVRMRAGKRKTLIKPVVYDVFWGTCCEKAAKCIENHYVFSFGDGHFAPLQNLSFAG